MPLVSLHILDFGMLRFLPVVSSLHVCGLGSGGALHVKGHGQYLCQGTGAVNIFLCPGYDTQSFMIALDKFNSHCSNPQEITSDQGSQLKKAAGLIEFGEAQNLANLSWDSVQAAAARCGTNWIFVPLGCQ